MLANSVFGLRDGVVAVMIEVRVTPRYVALSLQRLEC